MRLPLYSLTFSILFMVAANRAKLEFGHHVNYVRKLKVVVAQ